MPTETTDGPATTAETSASRTQATTGQGAEHTERPVLRSVANPRRVRL